MFIEKQTNTKGATPAGVGFLLHFGVSIDMRCRWHRMFCYSVMIFLPFMRLMLNERVCLLCTSIPANLQHNTKPHVAANHTNPEDLNVYRKTDG